MTIKEKVTALIGVSASRNSDLIDVLIEMCKDEATHYCHLAAYTEELDNAVVHMWVERYNRKGYEGSESVSASDISNHFIDGYSANTLQMLQEHRHIKTI